MFGGFVSYYCAEKVLILLYMRESTTKKAAIITGAARRIGRAMAIFLASKHKYDIFAVYNTSRDAALNLREIIQIKGQQCALLKADFRYYLSYEKIVSCAFSEMPHCNVLVNNASLFHKDTLKNCTIEGFSENFDVHVMAPVFLTKHFAGMCNGKGKIVNVVEANIERNKTKYFSYLLSKKSLSCFTKIAAEQLAPDICVNAICPTSIPDYEIDVADPTEHLDRKPALKSFLETFESLLDYNNSCSGKLLEVPDNSRI